MDKITQHYLIGSLLLITFFGMAGTANAAATEENTIDNGNGTYTFVQKVSAASTPPHYVAPSGYGFSEYSWFNEDYGWQHDFPLWNDDSYKITSATLVVRGWDVDSEPEHGAGGEYDGISIDGVALNPGLLQGTNNTWSETTFTVPLDAISDDGLINTYLDIDMNHTSRTWATTLDYSLLTINYIASASQPPFQPVVSVSPSSVVGDDDDLVVTVLGPTPADPDNDAVSYTYRWYVDVGQGFYVDDEFSGKANHTGALVPASQTELGERWKVEVYPTDSEGVAGQFTVASWYTIGDSDNDGVLDASDDFPLDAERAFLNYFPISGKNTLAFEDRWPHKGDYDMNDLVVYYQFSVASNADNEIKQITLNAELVARGGDQHSGFAISFSGVEDSNVESDSLILNGIENSISAEGGHAGELVYQLMTDSRALLEGNESYDFFNTESNDERNVIQLVFDVSFSEAVSNASIGAPPYNPFIFATHYRGREIHLRDHLPTDLADDRIFGMWDDASNPGGASYYRSSGNLPWALNISGEWKHPLEKIDILESYPDMSLWVETSGSSSANWYLSPRPGKCWKCN